MKSGSRIKLHTSRCNPDGASRVAAALRRGHWKPHQLHRTATDLVARNVGVPRSWVMLTNSCTTALATAYRFLGVTRASAPLLTYSATVAPALLLGVEVEPLDVDDDGWAKDPDIAVDLWGRAHPVGQKLPLIVDAAHRYAAPEHADLARRGVVICYSFGPQKELATPGGGALIWNQLEDQNTRAAVEAFLNYGQRDRVPTGQGGLNGYMPEPTAALLCEQGRAQNRTKAVAHRQDLLQTYENFLGALLLTKPGDASGHVAVARMPDHGSANAVRARARSARVELGIHYPISKRHQDSNAYALAKRIVTLPCHLKMSAHQAVCASRIVLTA